MPITVPSESFHKGSCCSVLLLWYNYIREGSFDLMLSLLGCCADNRTIIWIAIEELVQNWSNNLTAKIHTESVVWFGLSMFWLSTFQVINVLVDFHPFKTIQPISVLCIFLTVLCINRAPGSFLYIAAHDLSHKEKTLHVYKAFKGTVSFQLSQGLLTLMVYNLKLKADVIFF